MIDVLITSLPKIGLVILSLKCDFKIDEAKSASSLPNRKDFVRENS